MFFTAGVGTCSFLCLFCEIVVCFSAWLHFGRNRALFALFRFQVSSVPSVFHWGGGKYLFVYQSVCLTGYVYSHLSGGIPVHVARLSCGMPGSLFFCLAGFRSKNRSVSGLLEFQVINPPGVFSQRCGGGRRGLSIQKKVNGFNWKYRGLAALLKCLG